MNNTQLYLAIGVPSFLVVLSLLTNLVQIHRLSDRVDRQIEKLVDKVDRLAEQNHKDILMLMEQIVSLNGRLSKIEG